MQTKKIDIQQFVEKLQAVVNQPIWRVIHPADGWLFMDLGKQYQDAISDKDGSEKPYTKGEYQLQIKGDWTIAQGEKVIGARVTQPDETQEKYFTRMEALANNFPMKSFSNALFSDGNVIFEAENGYQLKVSVTGTDDALSFTIVELTADSKPTAYTHYRFDEEIGSLLEVSSQ